MDVAEKRMLQMARKKLPSPNITFTLNDVESADWKIIPGMISSLSNAVFQWLKLTYDHVHLLVQRLHPGGLDSYSTFGPETFCELTSLFKERGKKWAYLRVHASCHEKTRDWSRIFVHATL